jgi:hypothetical protein
MFPQISIPDTAGSNTIATNLMARVNFADKFLYNSSVYYTYDTQDGDTPEIIASKYYNNPYRFWLYLYGNQAIDPLYDLGLSSNNFTLYLTDKYGAAANANNQSVQVYTNTTTLNYLKTIETVDNTTGIKTTITYIIDYPTYNSMPSSVTITPNNFSDGSNTTVTISKYAQSIYNYENNLNSIKRNVNIINTNYADQLEQQFQSLMNT